MTRLEASADRSADASSFCAATLQSAGYEASSPLVHLAPRCCGLRPAAGYPPGNVGFLPRLERQRPHRHRLGLVLALDPLFDAPTLGDGLQRSESGRPAPLAAP